MVMKFEENYLIHYENKIDSSYELEHAEEGLVLSEKEKSPKTRNVYQDIFDSIADSMIEHKD